MSAEIDKQAQRCIEIGNRKKKKKKAIEATLHL